MVIRRNGFRRIVVQPLIVYDMHVYAYTARYSGILFRQMNGLHYKANKCNLHQIWSQLNCHLSWCNLSIALKAIILFDCIDCITTTIIRRNVSQLSLEKFWPQKAIEYDKEIPQSHPVGQLTAPRGRATEHYQSQDIGKIIKAKQLSLSSSSSCFK